MAHFARIENSVVTDVQVLSNNVITVDDVEVEEVGQEFLSQLFGGVWVQTSYNASFRKNFASIGCTYDSVRDAFIPPKAYPSWVLDEETCQWVAPIPMPETGAPYSWDEKNGVWVEVEDDNI
jgi:hypothetical protein